MDRNALAELLQALESRRDAEERRREERYTALIERDLAFWTNRSRPRLRCDIRSRSEVTKTSVAFVVS
ncbi:UNVERIFIED_CONTAM: hypothetical protein FKN15_032201 [Acipenser sinensis]